MLRAALLCGLLTVFVGKAFSTHFLFDLTGETVHLLFSGAADAEQRSSAGEPRLLFPVHLDAQLILDAPPSFFEIIHVAMVTQL